MRQVAPALLALISGYLAERLARHELTALTARNTRCALLVFAETLGNRPIERVGRRDVERFLEAQAHLAPATRRGRLSDVRQFCRWLVQRGKLSRDPTIGVKPPRQPRSVPRALPVDAVGRTLTQCPDARGRLIVILMVQRGLRCCEVSTLQVGDIDRQARTVRVIGKGNHERVLPLDPETETALDDYLSEYPASAGPLLRSYRVPSRALAADTISGLVSRWMAEAGVKRARRDGVSAHALRHSCATDMLRNGAHLRDVQAALGHAHLQTTEIYLPLEVKGLARAMNGRHYHGAAQRA